jgi:phage-related protein
MAVFTFAPSYGAQLEEAPRVRSVRFGDGYEQRQADGINVRPQVWSLTFANRTPTEIDSIVTFLRTEGGVTYFTWTPPRQVTALKFICRKWQRQIVAGGIDTLTAVFEQVFDA